MEGFGRFIAKKPQVVASVIAIVSIAVSIFMHLGHIFPEEKEMWYMSLMISINFLLFLIMFGATLYAYVKQIIKSKELERSNNELRVTCGISEKSKCEIEIENKKKDEQIKELIGHLEERDLKFKNTILDSANLNSIVEEFYKIQYKVWGILLKEKPAKNDIRDHYNNGLNIIISSIKKIVDKVTGQDCNVFLLRRLSSYTEKDIRKIQVEIIGGSNEAMREREHIDENGTTAFFANQIFPIRKLFHEALECTTGKKPVFIQKDIREYEEQEQEEFNTFNRLHGKFYNTVMVYSLVHRFPNKVVLPEGFLWIDSKTSGCLDKEVSKSIEPISKLCYVLLYTLNEFMRNELRIKESLKNSKQHVYVNKNSKLDAKTVEEQTKKISETKKKTNE